MPRIRRIWHRIINIPLSCQIVRCPGATDNRNQGSLRASDHSELNCHRFSSRTWGRFPKPNNLRCTGQTCRPKKTTIFGWSFVQCFINSTCLEKASGQSKPAVSELGKPETHFQPQCLSTLYDAEISNQSKIINQPHPDPRAVWVWAPPVFIRFVEG